MDIQDYKVFQFYSKNSTNSRLSGGYILAHDYHEALVKLSKLPVENKDEKYYLDEETDGYTGTYLNKNGVGYMWREIHN